MELINTAIISEICLILGGIGKTKCRIAGRRVGQLYNRAVEHTEEKV